MGALQIVDEPTGTVLWDFDDWTGTAPWAADLGGVQTRFGLGQDFDLSSPDLQAIRFEPPSADGGVTLRTRRALVTSSFRTRMRAPTGPLLRAAAQRLQQLMEAGGVMAYTFPGESAPVYIDYEPSPAPAILAGRPTELWAIAEQFDTPLGVLVAFVRQPALRGLELDPAVNLLVNSTLLGDSARDGTPDLWTAVAGTHAVLEAAEAYQNSHNAVSNLLTQNVTAGNGTYTLSGYARRVSGAGTAVLRVASVGGTGSADSAVISGATWQRYTVTVTAAGATTAIQAVLRQGVASGTSVFQFRNLQLEAAGTATAYRGGVEMLNTDPAAAGLGRSLPVWVDGTLPVRPRIVVEYTLGDLTWGVRTRDAMTGDRGLLGYQNGGKFTQVEGWVLGTDTAAAVDAQASPQSGNTVAITTFATQAGLVERAAKELNEPYRLNALRKGTWAVMLRYATTVSSTTFGLQLKWVWGGVTVAVANEEAVVSVTPDDTQYRDTLLGIITVPDAGPSEMNLWLFASRTAGTGSLKSDLIYLVPCDPLGKSDGAGGSTQWTEIDSSKGTVHILDQNFLLLFSGSSLSQMAIAGPLPVFKPGLNILSLSKYPDQGGASSAIATTYKVRVHYTPLYLT